MLLQMIETIAWDGEGKIMKINNTYKLKKIIFNGI
jgi:hypothetical protein